MLPFLDVVSFNKPCSVRRGSVFSGLWVNPEVRVPVLVT